MDTMVLKTIMGRLSTSAVKIPKEVIMKNIIMLLLVIYIGVIQANDEFLDSPEYTNFKCFPLEIHYYGSNKVTKVPRSEWKKTGGIEFNYSVPTGYVWGKDGTDYEFLGYAAGTKDIMVLRGKKEGDFLYMKEFVWRGHPIIGWRPHKSKWWIKMICQTRQVE